MLNHPEHTQYLVGEDSTITSVNGKILKTRVNEFGYVLVTIMDSEGQSRTKRVHRLVGETYIPNPDNKPEINHIDCCKTNNHVSNLEWVTSKENKQHAWEHKLYTDIAEDHVHAIHTNDTVRKICERFVAGESNMDICRSMDVPKHLVAGVRSGSIWAFISKDYNFNKKLLVMKTDEDIIAIADQIQSGLNDREVSEVIGCTIAEVNRIRNKTGKSKILDKYTFPPSVQNRMKPEVIEKVCKMLSEGYSVTDICEKLLTRKDQVKKLKGRKTFTNISDKYVW